MTSGVVERGPGADRAAHAVTAARPVPGGGAAMLPLWRVLVRVVDAGAVADGAGGGPPGGVGRAPAAVAASGVDLTPGANDLTQRAGV